MSQRILVIEDNEDLAQLLEINLKDLFYEVDLAFDGVAGLKKAETHTYHLVILDLILPDMNGSEVFDQLKDIDPKVKVLLSSGYSVEGDSSELLDRGCSDFIHECNGQDTQERVRGRQREAWHRRSS